VDVSSDTPFPPHFELSVKEALQYVLARIMLWRVLIKSEKNEETMQLFSPQYQSTKPKLDVPLRQYTDHAMVWRLFCCYLEFVVREKKGRAWHQCSRHLHNVIEASANSLDAWTIGLCVAVEGIASLVNIEEIPAEQGKIDEIIAHINEWLKSIKWTETTPRQRANGLLKQLKIPRVKDRLSALVQNGTIDSSLIKAWADSRNKWLHASKFYIDEIDAENSKNLIDQLNKITVLMYLITFHLIGYKEGYTDYSSHGCPRKYAK
jgi:hypothetical protein